MQRRCRIMICATIRWWHERQRQIDMQILWPECRQHEKNLERAKAAFAVHAFNDEAWQAIGTAEISRTIDRLT